MLKAEEIYQRFRNRPGSEHIASESAIRGLIATLFRFGPKRVLELGSGIGTLSYTIVSALEQIHGDGRYTFVMLEDNEFCRSQLSSNLGSKLAGGRLISSIDEIGDASFDMVVVDGGDPADRRFLLHLARRGTVFVEGFRQPQRNLLEASKRPHTRALHRSMQLEHASADDRRRGDEGSAAVRWNGGYWLYRFEPRVHERIAFWLRHLWDGVLVTKRRQLKLLREDLHPR